MPINFDHILHQANTANHEGKLEEAEFLYQEILQIKPDHIETYYNLSNILHKLKKFNEAEISYKKLIELKPDYPQAYNNLAVNLHKMGKFDEAEISYKKAISKKPDYSKAYYGLGNLLKDLNKLQEAEVSYKKAIELKPDFIEAYSNLGSLMIILDKLDDAEIYYRKVIQLKPNDFMAYKNLGLAMKESAKLDEAQALFKKAIELKPDFTDAHDNLDLMIQEKKLLNVLQVRKSTKNKSNKLDSNIKPIINPFISKRVVDEELLTTLYKINFKTLDKTNNVFFGRGRHSTNFRLFENNLPIIKTVEKDLIKIMEQAVQSKVFIRASFFNILRADSGSVPHTHISSFDKINNLINQKYSLQYYLSVGDQNCSEPGIFKLYDPNEEILPYKGLITIIPAYRKHSAIYAGKLDRVMIGVNFYSLF